MVDDFWAHDVLIRVSEDFPVGPQPDNLPKLR